MKTNNKTNTKTENNTKYGWHVLKDKASDQPTYVYVLPTGCIAMTCMAVAPNEDEGYVWNAELCSRKNKKTTRELSLNFVARDVESAKKEAVLDVLAAVTERSLFWGDMEKMCINQFVSAIA